MGGGVTETQYIGGNCLGGLGQSADLRKGLGLAKKRDVFEAGWHSNSSYVLWLGSYILTRVIRIIKHKMTLYNFIYFLNFAHILNFDMNLWNLKCRGAEECGPMRALQKKFLGGITVILF